MIESMDDAVGTLLDSLDRLGIAENTIITFASDNCGNMYNEVEGNTPTSYAPLRGGKANVYEGGVRVPCIVSWPGLVKEGSRNDALIQGADFYPILAQELSLKISPQKWFDGINIAPALKGGSLDRQASFSYFPHNPPIPEWAPPSITIWQSDWKLIRLFHQGENKSHRWKLYNLRADIGETTNLADQKPEQVKDMDHLIAEFLADTKAIVPMAEAKL